MSKYKGITTQFDLSWSPGVDVSSVNNSSALERWDLFDFFSFFLPFFFLFRSSENPNDKYLEIKRLDLFDRCQEEWKLDWQGVLLSRVESNLSFQVRVIGAEERFEWILSTQRRTGISFLSGTTRGCRKMLQQRVQWNLQIRVSWRVRQTGETIEFEIVHEQRLFSSSTEMP